MADLQKSAEILQEAVKTAKYTLLVRQLNKDLNRAGLQENYAEDITPASLARSFRAFLYDLIVSDMAAYLNLLYAIDVSERAIKALPANTVDDLATQVTSLILVRELKKVKFRDASF